MVHRNLTQIFLCACSIEDARNDIVIGAYKDTRYPTLFPGAELLAKGQWSRPEDDPGINSGFPFIWGQQAVCCDAVV